MNKSAAPALARGHKSIKNFGGKRFNVFGGISCRHGFAQIFIVENPGDPDRNRNGKKGYGFQALSRLWWRFVPAVTETNRFREQVIAGSKTNFT